MTIDPYVGSAGGQPRLTIPYMNDPSLGPKMNRILRTIYTWANSLLLPTASSSSITAWWFGSTNDVGANPITWTEITSSGFAYIGDSGTEIVALPDSSISLITYQLDTPSESVSENVEVIINPDPEVGPAAAYNIPFSSPPSSFFNNPIAVIWADSDNLASALPWAFQGTNVGLPSDTPAYLNIASWTKPS